MEQLREHCMSCLIADWLFLSTSSDADADADAGIAGKAKGVGFKKRKKDNDAALLDSNDLETVLMLYMPPPALTMDMVGQFLRGIGNTELHFFLRRLLFSQVVQTLATGFTPYLVGFFITLALMYLYFSFNHHERVYNPAVEVGGSNGPAPPAYDSL